MTGVRLCSKCPLLYSLCVSEYNLLQCDEFYITKLNYLRVCWSSVSYSFCFMISEDEQIAPLPAKVELKSNWDDEDVDDNEIKESWEDDDEPALV